MTKRTLFIIIGLLTLLDIAAIVIYLSAPNREGKSPLDFSNDKSSSATPAEIIPDKASLDDFKTYEDTVNFLSTDKVADGDEQKRMSATVIYKLVWPKIINKSPQFLELQNELMTRLTGKTYPNVEKMVKDLSTNPEFVKPSTHFSRVGTNFSNSTSVSHKTRHLEVHPLFSTHYLLEIEVIVDTFNGANYTHTFHIVHYDRIKGKILNIDNIFDSASTDDVLALINQSIESKIIETNNDQLHEISSIPNEFILGEKKVFFYVEQDGKYYEITVSNDDLKPYFTPYYNELLINDSRLVQYKN